MKEIPQILAKDFLNLKEYMERAPQTQARFFVEEHPENLDALPRAKAIERILTPETCQFLEDRGWGISLAMINLDEPTGRLIKRINQKFPNLPISAWVVLPDKDGYWTNRFNVPQTTRRVEEIKAWTNRFDLNLEAFGFDLEIPIENFRGIMTAKSPILGLLKEWIKVARSEQYKRQNKEGYSPEQEMSALLAQLKTERIKTHSYELPSPLDAASRGVLQNTDFDTRVTMVYSTNGLPRFIERHIPTVALQPDTYPGIGVYSSTGHVSGRSLGLFDKSPINPDVLAEDINTLAQKGRFKKEGFPDQIWVFALDGIKIPQWTEQALQKASQKA